MTQTSEIKNWLDGVKDDAFELTQKRLAESDIDIEKADPASVAKDRESKATEGEVVQAKHLSQQNKTELLETAKELNLDIPDGITNDQIRELIKQQQDATAV